MTPRRKRLGVIAGMWDPLDPIETTMTLIAVNISLLVCCVEFVTNLYVQLETHSESIPANCPYFDPQKRREKREQFYHVPLVMQKPLST